MTNIIGRIATLLTMTNEVGKIDNYDIYDEILRNWLTVLVMTNEVGKIDNLWRNTEKFEEMTMRTTTFKLLGPR